MKKVDWNAVVNDYKVPNCRKIVWEAVKEFLQQSGQAHGTRDLSESLMRAHIPDDPTLAGEVSRKLGYILTDLAPYAPTWAKHGPKEDNGRGRLVRRWVWAAPEHWAATSDISGAIAKARPPAETKTSLKKGTLKTDDAAIAHWLADPRAGTKREANFVITKLDGEMVVARASQVHLFLVDGCTMSAQETEKYRNPKPEEESF